MERQIWIAVAVTWILGGCSPTDCEGYYTYIPADRHREVPFSIKVNSISIELQYLDHSYFRGVINSKKDSIVEFTDEFNAQSYLECEGDQATLRFSKEYPSEKQKVILTRSKGDVYSVGEELGWEWGD